jgi:hypothetical protein
MSDHSGTANDQYLIDVTSGSLADDDIISDGTNTFTIAGTPDSCIITAELYNDDGALVDTPFQMGGCTSSDTNYRKITVASGERHDGTADSGTIWSSTNAEAEMAGLIEVNNYRMAGYVQTINQRPCGTFDK